MKRDEKNLNTLLSILHSWLHEMTTCLSVYLSIYSPSPFLSKVFNVHIVEDENCELHGL